MTYYKIKIDNKIICKNERKKSGCHSAVEIKIKIPRLQYYPEPDENG